MQPETPQPQFGPEITPVQPSHGGEHIPALPVAEAGIETGAERLEQAAEAGAIASDAAAPAMPIAAVQQIPVDPVAVTTTVGPAVANDDDVIEGEWVKKAKEIITGTVDDPHARSEKVGQLQKDYLKKRYGKELGAAS